MYQKENEFLDDNEINPQYRAAAAKKSTWISAIVNIFLSVGQVATGLISGSQGLIADGIHSLSDLIADFVVLIANHKSQKAPDDDHPYGHQRYENAASMILGLLLIVVGIGMLFSAIHKIQVPESIASVHIEAFWVAVIALVCKELLFRYMLRIAKSVNSSMLVANAWHARSDAASSLVVGIGIIGNLLGLKILDPIAALVVGLMITKMGIEFGWDALHVLMDRAADEETEQKIQQMLLSTGGILGFHDFKTRKMGDLIIVDVHLEVHGYLSVKEGHDIALRARENVMNNFPVLNVMTHIDPV